MRKKSIKIFLLTFIFTLIILLNNNIYAWDGIPNANWKHSDIWNNNKSEFFSKILSGGSYEYANKQVTHKNTEIIFCKQKGGTLRFTPSLNVSLDKRLTGDFTYCPLAGDKDSSIIADISNSIANQLENALNEGTDEWKVKNTSSSTIYFTYGGRNIITNGLAPKTVGGDIVIVSNKYYCHTPTYDVTKNETANSDKIEEAALAYIMSAGNEFSPLNENYIGRDLKKGNYNRSYSDDADAQLIQDALWYKTKDIPSVFQEGKNYSNLSAKKLYNEAQAYKNFKNEIDSNGYNPKFIKEDDTEKVQVIVQRDEKKYIIGPFKLEYPESTRKFSYLQDIYLIDTNGNKINTELKCILKNGGDRKYPNSGELFFIQFDAEKANYPTEVNVKAEFAYLKNCYAEYSVYEGTGKVYQLVGKKVKSEEKEHLYADGYEKNADGSFKLDKDGNKIQKYSKCTDTLYHGEITREEIGTYPAQILSIVTKRSRKWQEKSVKYSNEMIDLTMELGGIVWLDTKNGKETGNNNIYNSKETDKLMPNVTVKLYNSEGTLQKTTKTNSNGEYKFKKLNSMFQYYVEFTYNAQYFEPVEYVSPKDEINGWGNGTWKNNSNGTDEQAKRTEINARFSKIESSPCNYERPDGTYNETFTKMQLLGYTLDENGYYRKTGEAVIDEYIECTDSTHGNNHKKECYKTYGNLIKESSTSQNTQKMINYVQDCLLSSYTGKDKQNSKGEWVRNNNCNDLYPIKSTFILDGEIIDNQKKNIRNILMQKDNEIIKYTNTTKFPTKYKYIEDLLLYKDNNAYYINQGLTERQKADLALKKDVDKVTLEINGNEHTYTYDMLDKFKCNNCNQTGKVENIITNDDGNDTCPYCGSTNIQALWDIDVRVSDNEYYKTEYTRDLYPSDYLYRIDMYDNDPATYGKTEDDELKVFVTYKLVVKNQSQSIRCRVDEIVDYYDKDFTYVPERSYMKIVTGTRKGKYSLENTDANKPSMYTKNEQVTGIDGYKNLYIKDLGSNTQKIDKDGNKDGNAISEGLYLNSGETVYIYLTFEVKKDNNRGIILGEKENIAEINGYSTLYREGTEIPNVGKVGANKPAGLVDIDSNPGNLKPSEVPKDGDIKYNNFEDDTDKAPNIKLQLDTDNEREISGVVWEDERTNEIESAIVGDGVRDNQDKTLIDGVTVQLVELMKNGTEYVWKEFGANEVGTASIRNGTGSGLKDKESPIIAAGIVSDYEFDQNNHKGQYAFKSFVPGQYIVRFIYGDTLKTATPADLGLGGANAKSYNGQDYKSTTYQKDINATNKFEWREKSTWVNGQEILGNVLTEVETFKGDSSNNETAKATQKASEQEGYLYDILASDARNDVSDAKDIESRRDAVEDYSEENVTNTRAEVLASHTSYYQDDKYKTNNDKEKALEELMARTQMIAETGLINIEFEYARNETDMQVSDQSNSEYKIKNVDLGLEERPKAQLIIDKEVTNIKLTLADGSTLFDASKPSNNVLWIDHEIYHTDYTNNKMHSLEEIRTESAGKQIYGLIQMTMDEELMHGATIKITYKITVKNVGEVDYNGNSFYYRGIVTKNDTIVKTSANQVIDYVSNNLQFNKADNSEWNVIKKEDLITTDKLVNKSLEETIECYNTIISTDKLSVELVPKIYKDNNTNEQVQDEISVPLTLTQLITSENETDDLTYKNIVEIVKVSNTVGRRMEYSIVGNQDPTTEPTEVDSNIAQTVKILPPFGNAGIYIIVATAIILATTILAGGIIFIKKKVLK